MIENPKIGDKVWAIPALERYPWQGIITIIEDNFIGVRFSLYEEAEKFLVEELFRSLRLLWHDLRKNAYHYGK